MILTPNADCTEIEIQSDSFNASNTSNVLTIIVNGTTTYSVTLGTAIADYTFTPTDLELTTFAAGVYEFLLTSTLSTSAVETDLGCVALLCAYECDEDTLALYTSTTNIDKVLAYEGLKNFANCSTCSCTIANTLHDAFINETTTDVTSCGCGQA